MDESRPLMGARSSTRRAASTNATLHLNILRAFMMSLLSAFGTFLQGVCLCCCCIFILFIAFFPIIMAIVYWGAPCDRPLATFLLVYGLMPKNIWPRGPASFGVWLCYIAVNLFAMVWFVLGCVWTFSTSEKTCDKSLYLITFWFLTIILTLTAIGLCCLCILFGMLKRSRGLSEEQLDDLHGQPFQPESMPTEDAKCAICLAPYEPEESVLKLDCKHHMHEDCVKTWLQSNPSCPICRHPVSGKASGENAV